MKKIGIGLTILGPLVITVGFSYAEQILRILFGWENPTEKIHYNTFLNFQYNSLYIGLIIFILGFILALKGRAQQPLSNFLKIFYKIGVGIFILAVLYVIAVYATVFSSGW